jgi:predicted phosphodiesterase
MLCSRLCHLASCLLTAAVVLFAAPSWAVTLTRGPYLTLLTRTSVTVVWNTDIATNCGLRIGPTGGATAVLPGPGLTTACLVTAAGLTPGASYTYSPEANGVALGSPSTFRADHPTAPFRFGVVGDSGTGSTAQLDVRDRMLAGGLDLIVHTGDMIYDHGELAEQDPEFFSPYKDLLRQLVFWPVMGNHDFETASAWTQVHFTPANNAAHSEQYYSFDRGNAHFAVIDSDLSTSPGSPQYVFLDQDLAASSAQWKFVFFHHTIYVSSGGATGIRANLLPLFDGHHVDVVFMGHIHTYERSKPLRGGSVVAPGAGTVYVTTGGGGAPLSPSSASSIMAYVESAFHYTRVAINGGTLALEMIRRDGVVRDTMTLVKGVAGSTTTTTTSTSTTTTTVPAGVTVIDRRVAAGADDAEEAASGSVSLTSGDLELTRESTTQTVGMRFSNLAVPRGALIERAWVQFAVDEASTEATALTIAGQDADTSAPFSTATHNVSGRTRTPETVPWNPDAWPTVGAAGTAQRTPDLAAVIQRIVGRPGWTSGNALALIVTGTGHRVAVAFDGVSAAAPLLHVEYRVGPTTTSTTSTSTSTTALPPATTTSTTLPPPTTTTSTTTTTLPIGSGSVDVRLAASADDAEEDTAGKVTLTSSDLEMTLEATTQVVGMRFRGIAIPRGAHIVAAWVQFMVDEATSNATSLAFAGEAADNAATFTTAARNVSTRLRTAASVPWSPAAWPTIGVAGSAQRTPDLAPVIQEIVGRSGWTSGNSLALIVRGTGKRVAVAFDGISAGAPLLHVEYGPP